MGEDWLLFKGNSMRSGLDIVQGKYKDETIGYCSREMVGGEDCKLFNG